MLLELCEKMISLVDPQSEVAFFDNKRFPWTKLLEDNWELIVDELNVVLSQQTNIPNFQDISEDQKILTEGDDWKTFFFYAYGHQIKRNCDICPETVKLLQSIPGMITGMFSILAPGKHIPEHRGPYKGVLRYHLGLNIPSEGNCRIRVKDDVRIWKEGQSLVFDDSFPHEAWNDSNDQRVVLFVDFIRPLPFPASVINRMMIKRFSTRSFITDAVDSARKKFLPS